MSFTRNIYSEEGIQVKGKKDGFKSPEISAKEARRLPGTFGEPIKVIETLPGVTIPSFVGGDILIRGGNPNSNLYLIDDLPVYYPFHLLGLNSVISPYMFQSLSLEAGPYSAYYGNATGGVLAIKTNEEMKKEVRYVSTSLFSSQVHLDFLSESKKQELTVSGRINYLKESYGKLGLIEPGVQLPTYYDSQLKYKYNLSEQSKILFYNFLSKDYFSAEIPVFSGLQNTDSLLNGARLFSAKGFQTTALKYIYTPSENLENRLSLIYYKPYEVTTGELGTLRVDHKIQPGYAGIRNDLEYKIDRKLKTMFGFEIKKMDFRSSGYLSLANDPNNLFPNPYNSVGSEYTQRQGNANVRSIFAGTYWNIIYRWENWKFLPGIRYDYFQYTRAHSFTPRFRIEYNTPFSGLSLFSRAGETSRFPFDTSFIKETGNPNLQFEKVRSWGTGTRWEFWNDWEFQMEFFGQKLRSLVESDPYSGEYYALNTNPETYGNQLILPFRKSFYSNSGEGRTRGYEILIRKKSSHSVGDWNGWISYTRSQSFRQNHVHIPVKSNYTLEEQAVYSKWDNSKEYIYDYDQTHLFNIVLSYVLSKDVQIGLRWQYKTSTPYTPIIGDDGGNTRNPYSGSFVYFPIYSTEKNSGRLPPYQRLDIRIDKSFHYDWGYVNYYMEFINLYARKNITEQQFKTGRPYSEINPTYGLDPLVLPLGKSSYFPLINFGMEVKF